MSSTGPFCIALAGPSCAGKTSIAQRLASKLPGEVTVFGTDAYYLDLSHLSYAERCQVNFDHPDVLESSLLAEHLASLRQGKEIHQPVYDFSTHSRVSLRHEVVVPRDFLIVEGLFTLHWPEVRKMFDISVFVNAPDRTCLERRKARDVLERGRTVESVITQYNETVRPGNEQYILPSSAHAHLVLNGEQSVEDSAQQIATLVFDRIALRGTG
ncbi:MAG TPA: uridine kinase [Candidatus Angelobacter sp.]|jgi:uridine kinase|nr:uridine kinase [Candidatus Angelobacter sp.]